MSGIINSAGSRSGVIGTNELDYEEGEVTNAMTISTTRQTSYSSGRSNLQYTKIGRIVHVQCYCDTDGATLGDTGTIKVNLPFVISGGSSTAMVTGMNMAYLFIESQSYTCMINFDEDASLVQFNFQATGGSYATLSGSPSVSNTAHRVIIRLSCSYETDA